MVAISTQYSNLFNTRLRAVCPLNLFLIRSSCRFVQHFFVAILGFSRHPIGLLLSK